MAENYDIVVGVDCGLSGGIAIFDNNKLSFYKMPVRKTIVNKKNKNVYDMEEIVNILDKYRGKNVLFCVEKQGVRPGEGSVSAMTIGKGFGQLLGVSFAMRFKVVEVMSQTWKKSFPQLNTEEIIVIREEVKKLKEKIKKLKETSKKLKDKDKKKENKKQIDELTFLIKTNEKQVGKLSSLIKTKAKEAARNLVMSLYPENEASFVKKNTDGVAESILIAIYGKNFF